MMRRILMLLCVAALAGCGVPVSADSGKEEEAGKPFKLPDDAAGKLLGKALPPTKRPGRLDNPTRPAPPPAPVPALAGLEPALPDYPGPQPRRGPGAGKVYRPAVVTPEVAGDGFPHPEVPARPRFTTPALARELSNAVIVPPGLPYLASQPDGRVPLDDPTAEASGAAVLAGEMPERTKPVPYTRVGVPDPFEFRGPLPLPPVREKTTPRVISPPAPGPGM